MTLISIIIPIYNGEDYLEQCINSVLNQTIKELEIICIDDGSTDSSVEIIHKYQRFEKRIILLRQNNQGQGKARNNGIKIATGKYISFLDADDYYLDGDALEKMYQLCEENGVKVCGSFRKSLEPYGLKDTHIMEDDIDIAKKKKIVNYKDYQIDFEFQNFIYLRSLLISYNILFPSYKRFEDPVFLVKALNIAGHFSIANTYLYCYRVPNAVQRGGTNKTIDLLSGMIDNLKYAEEYKLEKLFRNTVNHMNFDNRYLITHDIQQDDIGIIERLIEATHIIRSYYNQPNYIVNPLKDIINGYRQNRNNYAKHLEEVIENNNLIVYGAGNISDIFLNYLKEIKQIEKVKYIMVSSEVTDEKSFHNIPLISVHNLKKSDLVKEHFVFIATTGAYHEEIINNLMQSGFSKYEPLDDAFLFEYADNNLLVRN